MKKLKCYYYSPGAEWDLLFLATPPLYLNSFLRVHYPELAEQIEWQKMQYKNLSQAQLVEDLNKFDIDILCISSYIWNSNLIMNSIEGIKKLLKKDINIIMGGPSTDVVRNKSFLKDRPDIDFAVYSQGEQAFADILQHILGIKKLSLLHCKNTSWRDGDKIKVADFQFYKFEKISPYLISKDLIELAINDPDYKDNEFVLPYETSRGCPYNCTFCDWTSGLSHKTYFRKFDIEEEIDTIGKLGIENIHLSDANFGQHKQDVEIAKTIVRLKKEKNYNFKIDKTNFSKLLKDRVFEIVDILIDGEVLHEIKFAVQDTHDEILNNIERPDIPFNEHKVYIDNVNKKYPHIDIGIELIQGLPGQTRETWAQNLIKIQPYRPIVYYWNILPNSPAGYDPDYRNKMQIQSLFCNLIYADTQEDGLVSPSMEFVISSYSYSFEDFCYFTLLSKICTLPKLQEMHEFIDRAEFFSLINKSDHLNSAILEIKKSIENNKAHHINLVVLDFCKNFTKENHKSLPKDFVRFVLTTFR